VSSVGHGSPGAQALDGAHADIEQQAWRVPVTYWKVGSRVSVEVQTWFAPQPAVVPGVQVATSAQADGWQHWFPPGPSTHACAVGCAKNTDEVVTARWKSMGSSPFSARAALTSTIPRMKSPKLAASPCCFGSVDGESSTTKRTSALETLESATRVEPGWMRQRPTGSNV
jgi:hypothetical protein